MLYAALMSLPPLLDSWRAAGLAVVSRVDRQSGWIGFAAILDEIEAAQKYISVASDMKLLDGKHRWRVTVKKFGVETQMQVAGW
jgi:hypothetical protein